jgi:hypothetical protein
VPLARRRSGGYHVFLTGVYEPDTTRESHEGSGDRGTTEERAESE